MSAGHSGVQQPVRLVRFGRHNLGFYTDCMLQTFDAVDSISMAALSTLQCSIVLRLIGNVLSNLFQCARKSIVFERHIFMSEHLNFFTDVAQVNKKISLI